MSSVGDHWERIWSPHRKEYNEKLARGDFECPFCAIPKNADSESLILARGEYSYVVLNRYPYNPGHLLICTFRHVGEYLELSDEEITEITILTRKSLRALRAVNSEVNFNIGINQGRIAGAGIPEHFHQHIVPRWQGDSNFMPVVGGTKVLSQMLDETREILVKLWPDSD
jgi:ATP adenylyltransferase